jgi:hypothetical protein
VFEFMTATYQLRTRIQPPKPIWGYLLLTFRTPVQAGWSSTERTILATAGLPQSARHHGRRLPLGYLHRNACYDRFLVTRVMNVRLVVGNAPVISQQPSVGKSTPLAWKPVGP